MDDKWFKNQQKKAGVTAEGIAKKLGRDRSVVSRIYNGHQKMTADQAEVFAEVLNAPLEEVVVRAGILSAPNAQRVISGFSEGDVAPWRGQQGEGLSIRETARSLGGDKPGVDVWSAKTNVLMLNGIISGDYILVDTNQSEICKAGDCVIAQVYDWTTGSASTVLRRFEPPVLVSTSAESSEQRIHIVDGTNVVIKGKVIASWRR